MLLLGPPGSGKSDLLLRLLDRPGWRLVGDDQVILCRDGEALLAEAPAALRGMLEVRGLGLLEGLEREERASLRLVVECAGRDAVPRLPLPRTWHALDLALPVVAVDAFAASAPKLVELALESACGRGPRWHAGAFEAAEGAAPERPPQVAPAVAPSSSGHEDPGSPDQADGSDHAR